ncbi:hypothetical protein BLNAU_1284 [Blattamonas nauphoetae]|uniref:Protein kinase domain-containing protein n=1 Tax=Blattamonas nauphoetae TaxID=2049346 RepID=A0ABQ9YIZ9_9EUKA|nr:hypothetical protein BLNAU_1284 [Blattamonas nauphoetae]
MFDLRNTTFSLFSTQLVPAQHAFHLDGSTLTLHRTSIVLSSASSPIVSKTSQTVLNEITISANRPDLPLPTLVNSDATNNHATMTGTTICNFVVNPNSPILTTVETPQTISSCVLANLTQLSMSTDDQISSKSCEVMMAGSSVVSVENPLYGCVVPNINTAGSFFFLNSSFTHASASYQNQHFTNTNQYAIIVTDDTVTFDTCTFTGCTSDSSGGSFFFYRTSSDGGAFKTECTKSVLLDDTKVENCRSVGPGGGVVLNCALQNCQATNNNFTNCSGSSGSAIHRNCETTGETTIITGNRFVECISKAGTDYTTIVTSGVVIIRDGKTVVYSSNLFQNNQVGTDKWITAVHHVAFTSISAEYNEESSNIALGVPADQNDRLTSITHSMQDTVPLSQPWCFSGSQWHSSAPSSNPTDTGTALVVYLVHYTSEKFMITTSFVGTHALQLAERITLTTTLSLDMSACNKAGIAKMATESKLDIKLSSLTLSSSPLTQDLFVVDSSSLIIKSSTFPAMEFESTSILCVRGDSTVQVNSITTNTISQSGALAVGGCFVRVEGSSPATITVTGSTFGVCSTTGSGGWGSCDFGEGGKLEVIGTTFTTCTAAGKGDRLLVSHPSLSTCLSATTLSCLGISATIPTTKSETDPFVPLVHATSSGGWEGSILFHLFPHTTEDGAVHLHTQGHHQVGCGKLQLPCLSLDDSLASLKENRTIFFDTSFDLKFGSSRPITQDLSLTSDNPITTLSLFSSDPIHLQNGCLSFSSITFQLPTIVSSSLFVVTGGTLQFPSTVTLVNPTTASLHVAPLIDISGGQLDVDSSVFEFSTKLTMSGASMISQTGGNVIWKGVALSNVECSVDATSKCDSPLTSSLTDGCLLSIGVEGKETSFTNCGSEGDGGVLNVKIVSTGSLSITNTVFKKCCSSKNGGVLFLDLTGTTSSTAYSFSQLTFGAPGSLEACTATAKGQHMFFAVAEGQAEALLTPLNSQSLIPTSPADSSSFSAAELSLLEFKEGDVDMGSVLFVFFKEASNVVVDETENVGLAHPLCGHSYLPCGSVNCGYHNAVPNEANKGSVTMKTDISLLAKLTTTDKEVTMAGAEGKKLTVTADGQFEVPIGKLTFSSITLQIPSIVSSSLFVVAGGSLQFSSTVTLVNPTTASLHVAPLVDISGGQLDVDSSVFEFSTKLTMSGASMISQTGGNVIWKGVALSNVECSADADSNCDSPIASSLSDGSLLSIGVEGKETSFTNCGSEGDGGVLNVKIVSTGSLSITNTVFKKCCSSKNGGVLFLDLTGTTSSTAYSFSQLTFGAPGSLEACTATAKGQHMFFAVTEEQAGVMLTPLNTQSLIPSTPADGSSFSAAELSLLEFREGGVDVGSVLFVFFKEASNVVVDGTDNVGLAHPLCGHAYLPCGSVIGGYDNAGSNEAKVGTVSMKTDISLLAKLTTTGKDVTMAGMEGKKLTITEDGQFEVSAGSLTYSSITLQLTLPLTSTPFVVNGGQLSMTATSSLIHTGTPTSPTILSECLFHVTSGSLSIAGSETTPQQVSSFSAQSPDSCLIRVDTSQHSNSEPSLELIHCEFTNNVGTSAGVISLSGSAGGSLKMDHCFFMANSGSTSKDVLVVGGWAQSVSSSTVIACFSESDLNHLVVEGTPMNTLIPFSVLFVHPTLSDDSSCNQPTVSCSTILKSLTHCTQTEPGSGMHTLRTIEMEANQKERSTLAIATKRVIIKASSTDFVLTWEPLTPSSLLTVSTGSASLVSFVLSLPSDQSTSVLVLSGAGELKLTNLKLDGANPARNGDNLLLASSFIETKIATGSLSLVSVNVSNVDIANHPLISTVGKVEIESCWFENIDRSEYDGKTKASVLQSTLSSSPDILVKNTEFTSCVGNDEERWIELSPTTTMTFSASQFEGSFSASSPLLANSVNNPQKVPNTQFNPYSLLYEFHPANPTQIVVWSEKSVEDHPLCGNVSMPCLTVNEGIALTKVWSVEISTTGILNNTIEVTSAPLTLTGQNAHSTLVFVGQSRILNTHDTFGRLIQLSRLVLDVSQSTLVDDSVFVMEAGSLEITKCSLVSTNNISFSIMNSKTTVQIDELTLTNLNFTSTPFIFSSSDLVTLKQIEVEKCHFSTLVSCASVQKMTVESCHFTGITQPLTRNEEGLCGWSTGLISLSDTNCTLRSSSFVDLDDGGLIVSDSELHIESSTFHDNTPNDAVFVSARKNIACVGESVVVVGSLSGGDGVESSSLWISTNESCLVMKEGKEHLSPLFVPTFDSNNSKVTTENNTFTLSLSGSLLIPCGLYLVVYEVGVGGEGVRGKTKHVPLTSAKDWIETSLKVNLSENEIDLNTKFEWRLTLGYGNECETSESILVKQSLAAERKALTIQMMKWLIPVLVASAALLIIFFFIIICCHRRRKNKSKQPNQQQLTVIDDLPEEKIEEEDFILRQHTAAHVEAGVEVTDCIAKTNATGFTKHQNMDESVKKAEIPEMAEVVRCEDPVDVVMVDKRNTLFNILHKDKTQLPIPKVELQKKIVKGLAYLGTIEPTAPILKKLSTHWILIDASGNPTFLRQDNNTLNTPAANNHQPSQLDHSVQHTADLHPPPDKTGWEDAIQAEPHNPLTQNRSMDTLQSQTSSFFGLGPASVRNAGMSEAIRWQAPEQENGREGYDACKAAVFRLGLVLWEIETGKVPFGEQDAVNASRQLCTGTQPVMEGVGEDLEELIKQCLVLDPKSRLSLLEVAEFFFNKNELTFELSKGFRPPLQQ